MSKLLSMAAVAATLSFASVGNAAVVIQAGPDFVQPDENVQLDSDPVLGDNLVLGTTNQTNTTVTFQSSTDNLLSEPQGQAKITAVGSGASNGLGSLVFSLEDVATFTSAEFNILATTGGVVTLSAFDAANMLLASISPTISASGQNFFGFLADSSTPLSSISISAAPGTRIASIGQFRVGGVSTVPASPVPEPAAWAMMLIGFGFLGTMLRRRGATVKSRVRFV